MSRNVHESQPKSEPKKPNYARRRAVAGLTAAATLFGAGAVTHKAVDDFMDSRAANSAQPVCEIPARQGDSISRIETRIKAAGDDVRAEHVEVVAFEDGHIRNINDDPTFFVNGSMALRAGDTVVIDNVEPNACVAAGGMSPIEQAPVTQATGK